MKQFIALILTLCICVSCVTPSHTFLAYKHGVSDNEIIVIQETKTVSPYSTYFEWKELVEFTSKGVTNENYDSLECVYFNLQNSQNVKSNCNAYDVLYKLENDTLKQRVFFINDRFYRITHDNDIIIRMRKQVRKNLYRFNNLNNKYPMVITFTNDSIFI